MPRTKNHVYFAVYEGVILIVATGGLPDGGGRSCSSPGKAITSDVGAESELVDADVFLAELRAMK